MSGVLQRQIQEAREIQGQLSSGGDTVVPPPLWTDFARLCWPEKTAAHLAALGGKDERTAKRWLSGEYEPPMVVVLALFNKMFERRS
jgi:hypothetical protein